MDLSSLSEVQQEQLQDLQEKFKEHQAQRQQEEQEQQKQQLLEQNQPQQQQPNQHYASQVYDPSHVQGAHDPNHAYYAYYQQHSQNPQQNQLQDLEHQQQHYGYDQSGYANPYQQQVVQQESVPVQAAGVTVNQEGAAQIVEGTGEASGQGQVQHQQNMYNSSDPQQQQQQQGMTTAAALAAIAAYPGLNPAAAAAVAALSQLTQFAGTMGAAERAMSGLLGTQFHGNGELFRPMMGPELFPGQMHPMVGQPPFIGGGGRRGRGPFRGGNRGNLNYPHARSGGSGSSLRGRGRGRGRGGNKHSPSQNDAPSESSEPNDVGDNVELSEQKEPPVVKAEVETDTTPSVSAPVMVAPKPGLSQAKWSCEICKVDCNSLDIFEQHKNGKKHMKNLQKNGQLKISDKPDSQQEVIKVEQPAHSIQQPAEVTPTLQVSDQLKNSSLVGTKRKKIKCGRGKKHARTFESSRQPYEPPKPKVVIPIMCNLCNIKCDTREVFDRHLAGKKHVSKQKRYEGHQAMYGPMVQALYPPNPIAQSYYQPQGQQEQPFYGTQSLYPPAGPYMPPQSHGHAAAPMGYYPPQN